MKQQLEEERSAKEAAEAKRRREAEAMHERLRQADEEKQAAEAKASDADEMREMLRKPQDCRRNLTDRFPKDPKRDSCAQARRTSGSGSWRRSWRR